MTEKLYLIVEKGCVKSKSRSGIVYRTYYSKGNALRADWEDYEKKSVSVQLDNGKMLVINSGGVIIKTI